MDFAAPSKAPSTKQACDNCRRRKIKCSRDLPCDKCQRLLLSCSYSDVLRRKGPKFRTSYTLALIHPVPARGDTATPYQDKLPHFIAFAINDAPFASNYLSVSFPTPSIGAGLIARLNGYQYG
ncbi:hypothetical protein PENANT_c168G05363 [Penicillium antarcticum]|uniref:Zn(2)-C6 fungal-type domain-containing protein n=1 Tax=Penicillium antarcticum TaxID=416450 RepID=A0A1V6PD57_9EURO|nr:hypothetical protein PENANT_c168G05363 [Penicillium antarcticum]